jgi:hypothetical protein
MKKNITLLLLRIAELLIEKPYNEKTLTVAFYNDFKEKYIYTVDYVLGCIINQNNRR